MLANLNWLITIYIINLLMERIFVNEEASVPKPI